MEPAVISTTTGKGGAYPEAVAVVGSSTGLSWGTILERKATP